MVKGVLVPLFAKFSTGISNRRSNAGLVCNSIGDAGNTTSIVCISPFVEISFKKFHILPLPFSVSTQFTV